jgi:hypothetical protein
LAGYVMVPSWFRAKRPSANALLVYVTLAAYGTFDTQAGVYAECRPRLSTIVEDSGLSESTVKRSIGELLELGAVTRRLRFADDGKTPLPTVYRVVFGELLEPSGSTGEPTGGSADEPRVGPPVGSDQEPSTQNPSTQKERAARGTRLPEPFLVTAEMRAWYREHIGAQVDGQREHEKFVDYWRANGKAMKDWPATWRNWMRRATEQRGTRGNVVPFKSAAERRDDQQRSRLTVAQLADQIMERNGWDYRDHERVEQAMHLARQAVADNPSPTSTSDGYIEGEWQPTSTSKEVTGGEADRGGAPARDHHEPGPSALP